MIPACPGVPTLEDAFKAAKAGITWDSVNAPMAGAVVRERRAYEKLFRAWIRNVPPARRDPSKEDL